MTLHPQTFEALAGARQADLAREAEASRLGRLAEGIETTATTRLRHAAAAVAALLVIVLGVILA